MENRKLISAVLAATVCLSLSARRTDLNAGWRFARLDSDTARWEIHNQGSDWSSQFNVETAGAGSAASSLAVPDSVLRAEASRLASTEWQAVRLPHTAFEEPYVIVRPWQGICYYTRTVDIDPSDTDSRKWLEFEGAMQLADIWINGRHAAQHAGGFTSFVVDATDYLRAGTNEVTVRLDNRDNPLIPPGKPLSTLDFCYHSGLYRDVNLITKPAVHITHPLLADKVAGGGIFVTYPEVSERKAVVAVATDVANTDAAPRRVTVRQTLRRKGSRDITRDTTLTVAPGSSAEVAQRLAVSTPALWYPDSPQLYTLVTELVDDAGRVTDSETTRIGIRRIDITPQEGLTVNGRPYRLEGTNRHQEYPYVGNAISDRAQYRDMYQIRDNGFNIVRLGHYPQDPSVLDACDELGLLAIEPIPGWQFYSADSTFRALTFRNIQEMIRRDRNHPCIAIWETTLNESWPPAEWKDAAVATAHAEMPAGQCLTSGDSYGYSGFDVCYNDWDDPTFTRPNNSGKPGFIREYYDYEFGGHYSTTRVTRGDGPKALMQNLWNAQWSDNAYRGYYPSTAGAAVWSMYDYNRGCCDNICYSGVADLFRLPKFSLPFYRLQTAPGAYTPSGKMKHELFAPTYWDGSAPVDTLPVYGNVDEVELRVNGRLIGRRGPDSGPTTGYVASHDGGNCANLAFPPFTFTGIGWEPGTLELTGYAGGRKVATATVRTPGEPRRLDIGYFEGGKAAAANDLIIVNVSMLDRNGTLCPRNGVPVSLAVEGGRIAGPATVDTEAGVASFVVATDDARKLRLSAASGDMASRRTISLAR